jgi:hypothetical protein
MSGRWLGFALWAVAASSVLGQTPEGSRRVPGTLSQLAWLAGTWSTSGPARPGAAATFEERWTPPAGGAMLAVARTLKGDRMTGFEFLRIVEREGSLFYIAQPGGRPPTEFALTLLTADGATFENPAHDFPKVIRYRRTSDNTLEARVSDGTDTNAEVYLFTRQP